MEVLYSRCAGLDVHKATVVAAVRLVAGGKVAREVRTGDATWLAELLAHGLIRASFVPDTPTQELRALLRTRKQLVREKASHTQRLQKTLEDILTSCGDDPAVLVWAIRRH